MGFPVASPTRPPPAGRSSAEIQADLDRLHALQKGQNNHALIALTLLLLGSIAVGVVNYLMEDMRHKEKMACIELRKVQKDAQCSDGTWRPDMPTSPLTGGGS